MNPDPTLVQHGLRSILYSDSSEHVIHQRGLHRIFYILDSGPSRVSVSPSSTDRCVFARPKRGRGEDQPITGAWRRADRRGVTCTRPVFAPKIQQRRRRLLGCLCLWWSRAAVANASLVESPYNCTCLCGEVVWWLPLLLLWSRGGGASASLVELSDGAPASVTELCGGCLSLHL